MQTYVTEDGQTGHLIIGNGTYHTDDNSTSSSVVTLGSTNITAITSPDGSVLSLGEDAMEQLAGESYLIFVTHIKMSECFINFIDFWKLAYMTIHYNLSIITINY